MKNFMLQCEKNYKALLCCQNDDRAVVCDCSICLQESFYSGGIDTYDCEKKVHYYVLNYGPSYASEIYYYLSQSKILEYAASKNKKIKILSLGCGFAPDLLAITKYITVNNLSIEFEYYGIDKSIYWANACYFTQNASFQNADVTSSINLTDYDLVFIVKLFSTLKRHGDDAKFLSALKHAVQNQLKSGGAVVFIDVNNKSVGRDEFDQAINPYFEYVTKYRFAGYGIYCVDWVTIGKKDIAFSIPSSLQISPLPTTGETICFEYVKK